MNLLHRSEPCTLPLKAVQFGEGNFMRAYIDWMIDRMNKSGLFNGSVRLVQPRNPDLRICESINAQDGLYTLILRGIEHGELVEDVQVIESVKDCINAVSEWDKCLATFRTESLRFCFSNTTEAGIVYNAEAYVPGEPQTAFPAKLTALLLVRFRAGLPGLVFMPCELIDRNGEQLRECMLHYAADWQCGDDFADYIRKECVFCNTLVDRIVAGYPKTEADDLCRKFGYMDNLIVCGEPFHFLALEGAESIRAELPLEQAGINVVYTGNLNPYRTRKVRFLNGAHTAMVPAAYLAGFDFVDQVVNDPFFGKYVRAVLMDEVLPTVDLPDGEKRAFAAAVSERFANPFAMHRLLSIALNSVSKWKVRILPTLLDYYDLRGALPPVLTFSLAALIAFYRNENATGPARGGYPIADNPGIAEFFEAEWRKNNIPELVRNILGRTDFWDTDLNIVPGMTDTVTRNLERIMAEGTRAAAGELFA